jgi:hypothetical protein
VAEIEEVRATPDAPVITCGGQAEPPWGAWRPSRGLPSSAAMLLPLAWPPSLLPSSLKAAGEGAVRKLGNFRYILIPEIINMFMTNMSDPVRAKHVLVFKLNLK